MEPGSKVSITGEELSKFTAYVSEGLDESLDQHSELEDRLDEWDLAYAGDPKEKRKTFPWPGAANLEIPIIAIAVDSIVARLMNTIYSVEPLWTASALKADVEPFVKPVQDYLDWSRKNEYDMYGTTRKWCNEVVKHGWGWLKYGWERYTQAMHVVTGDGSEIRYETVRRPVIHHILNRDMIVQAGVEDETQAEWIAQRFRLTDNQLRLRAIDKHYAGDDLEDILKSKEDATRVHTALAASKEQPSSWKERMNTLYEFGIDWPYGPENVPTPMIATYHRPTRKFLRIILNPYGFRMWDRAKFIEREGRGEGYGICKALMQIQAEISTIHRQQVDNGTIANTKFFLGKRNVVRTNTPIWPGRVLGVNDPNTDLKVMDLGTPGAFQAMRALEMQALMYAERRSGVSDYQLGRESSVAGSRATATGTMALIQEGNRRFDLNIRDLRSVLSRAGRRMLEINQIFRPKGAAYFVQGEEGKLTEKVLDLPPDFTAARLAIELTASTATVNRATEKQELIALMGLLERYHQGMAQLGMMIFSPQAQTPDEVKKYFAEAARGSTRMMRRIAQTFDQKSVNDLVPALIQEPSDAVGQAQPPQPGGGTGDAEGASQYTGMAELFSASGRSTGNGEGRVGGVQ